MRSAHGPLVRQSGPYLFGRRHDHGYDLAYHHTDSWAEVCHRFHLPWLCSGLQRSVFGYLLLFDLSKAIRDFFKTLRHSKENALMFE